MSVFDKILNFSNEKNIGLLNMTDEFFALYLKKMFETNDQAILVVAPTMFEANNLWNHISNYNDSLLFQEEEFLFKKMSSSNELLCERLNVLNELILNNKRIVVTDVLGYLKYLPNKNNYLSEIINLKVGDKISYSDLIMKLDYLGYSKETIVTKTGEMAIRGFIIDVFVMNDDNPIRIEFFGDEIESIRYFDCNTQTSLSNIIEKVIYPFNENICGRDYVNILSYLKNPIVVFKDYEQIRVSYERILNESMEYEDYERTFFDLNDIKFNDFLCYMDFDNIISSLKISKFVDFKVKKIERFNENFDKITSYVKNSLSLGKTVVLALSTINVNKFSDMIDLDFVFTNENDIKDNCVNIINKSMVHGFEVNNYVFLTEYELFSRKKEVRNRKSSFKFGSRIKDINKLEQGDFVVHELYGVGVYNGIKTVSKNGVLGDYIEILYDKGDKLYIPASKIELISKFSSKEGYVPKINALNSSSWTKSKQRIREKIKYEAERLIRVQAERKLKKGFAFSSDDENQILFENEFVYEETLDQRKVSDEIKSDMEKDIPMDRILCGDVGYGKTEVAFRAIFKAINDGKQVLYLCPTTLLSKQQYESALDRFKNYPINIELLNRFTSPKKSKEILKRLEEGKVDLVIGTHRLLSNDIRPLDLGLLVIDEEQRFGVAHKEKIKEYKSNVDVLTLTATPIPRTLQMAMLGIKNLSLIETPPKNRKPIQTYVTAYDNKIIRDIIYKELSRNGQVFILYNKVSDIDLKANLIQRLVPEAKVIYAHGQMGKDELENRMNDFIDGEYNVLVCTTIIETGVDIPNVNSLIVLDADRFGLSQLYQIRGRVGRGDKIAYAYLMYAKDKILSEASVKRLKVIKEFTELGSGFHIATRDLSIRGAGDILGSEQAGFIDTVGIDLYMKMLNDEVNRLKGIEVEDEIVSDISPVNVNNHIKDEYVEDEELKIEIHKLINSIDSLEALNKVKAHLEDRFGMLDYDLILYMNQQLFEKLTKKLGIFKVFDNNNYMEVILTKEKTEQVSYEDLFISSIKIGSFFEFSYKNKQISIRINKNKVKEHPIIYFNLFFEKM